jgi:hypothetical protein
MQRHSLDALSLVFGLLFVAAGLLLLSGGPALSQKLPMEWVGPLVAIGLGTIILLAARPERKKPDEDDDAAQDSSQPEAV